MTLDYTKPIPAGRRWLRTALIVLGGIGALAVIIVVAGAVLISQMFSGPKVDLVDFESVKWKAASAHDATYNSVRLRMADSFLADQQPVGKSRDQVVALLGEPDDTPYFRSYDMVYYLGPERHPFGVDSEWLVLKLTDGKVTEARLVTD